MLFLELEHPSDTGLRCEGQVEILLAIHAIVESTKNWGAALAGDRLDSQALLAPSIGEHLLRGPRS